MCLQSPCKDVFTVAASDGVRKLIPEIRRSIGERPLCQTRFCVVVGRFLKKEVIIASPWTVFNNWISVSVSACRDISCQERCYVYWCKIMESFVG